MKNDTYHNISAEIEEKRSSAINQTKGHKIAPQTGSLILPPN